MKNAKYGSSLTDDQWEYLKPMLPKPAKLGRPPTDLRQVIDAIFYVVKGGIPWRYLPADLPPWQTVYGIFRRWKHDHFWGALNDALRILVRKAQDRRSQPTAAILDSQSVKSAGHGGEVGYDAGKRIKGRKRHLVVDTLGLVLGVLVTPANTTERDGAKAVLLRVLAWFTWLRILWVDGGYTGPEFANWVKACRSKLKVEVVKRSDDCRDLIIKHL
jgi:putative transposase